MTHTLTRDRAGLLCDALDLAIDRIAQYERYSDEMAKIGRGCYVISPYGDQSARAILEAARTVAHETYQALQEPSQ